MRIISGIARGTRLATIGGEKTRPTSDRVKESMFAMVHFDLPGSNILDLFAGSGQLGLEALSRGGARATFVDNSSECTSIIKENAGKARLFDRCVVCTADYASFISGCREKFDIIILDPPYGELVHMALETVFAANILADGGMIVVESEEDLRIAHLSYTVRRSKRYGRAFITVLDMIVE